MLKSNKQRVFEALVNNRISVLSKERQMEILRGAKSARNVDYVSQWVIPQYTANSKADQITTRANWHFILTDISIWENDATAEALPRFNLSFESLPANAIFKDRTKENADKINTVPARLCVGSQGLVRTTYKNYHFEEPKDTLIIIPQRSVIGVTIRPYVNMNGFTWNYQRGALLLSGIEVAMENMGVPNG